MTTYYTFAKNRKGNSLRVPIEAKHVYKNPNSLTDTAVLNSLYDWIGKATDSQSTLYLPRYGNKAEKNTATILYCSNNTGSTHYPNGWNWTQGTQSDQVIGNKIMVKSIRLHYEITLSDKSFYWPVSPFYIQKDTSSTSTQGKAESKQNILISDDNDTTNRTVDVVKNTAWRRDFRVQVLHFEDDLPKTDDDIKIYLSQWFDTTYVPTTINATQGNDQYGYTLEISNKVQMMRESTGFTGKFKKIQEFSFSLSADKPYHQFDITLDPHKQVNLGYDSDNHRWLITDDWWKNTVIVMWNPMNYKMDMDPMSAHALTYFPSEVPSATGFEIGQWTYMAKLTYYDV